MVTQLIDPMTELFLTRDIGEIGLKETKLPTFNNASNYILLMNGIGIWYDETFLQDACLETLNTVVFHSNEEETLVFGNVLFAGVREGEPSPLTMEQVQLLKTHTEQIELPNNLRIFAVQLPPTNEE